MPREYAVAITQFSWKLRSNNENDQFNTEKLVNLAGHVEVHKGFGSNTGDL